MIFSLSLIIWFCFSQKRSFLPKSSCPVYQTFQPGEDSSAHALNFRSNQDQHCSSIFRHEQKITITDDTNIYGFLDFFLRKFYGFQYFRFFNILNLCVGRETVPPLRSMTVTDDDSFERLIFGDDIFYDWWFFIFW